ncbi:MAG: alpha/beta fold hydrolase [Candidatus Binatia bacterium]
MPTKYTSVGGIPVQYLHAGPTTLPGVVPDLGRGEVLLFIHGAGSNGHIWRRHVAAFAEAHSPLAFDFPGHGRSGGTESLKSITAYREFLAAFVDALGLRPAVLVGHSMGGAIAIDYTLAYPERVRGLALVASAARFELPPPMLETWKNVMQGRMQQPFTTEAFSPQTSFAVMREVWMEQVKTDPRVRYFDLVACNQVDLTAQLGNIKVPTLIVAGRDDGIASPQCTEVLHRGITGSTLAIIDHAGHSVPVEQPEEFRATLHAFLATLS